MARNKIYKALQELPGHPWLNYIILPYGEFYQKTRCLLDAKNGDILRFFNGPDVHIESILLIRCDRTCDFLCKMRYGLAWDAVFAKWLSYARMEGHGKDILDKNKCLLIVYKDDE